MDFHSTAPKGLKSAFNVFLKDLQALPEEAFTKSFGPKVRTVADIVYEVNLVNDHVMMTVRGETPFEWPDQGWIKAPAGFDSKAAVIEAFEKSSSSAMATFDSYTPEEIEGTVVSDGQETTRFERCRFMTLHTWYHCGQLNYIQTLLGDDVWHWA